MDYLVTLLEGVITFVSPCLLPLLPVYIAYFAGGMGAQSSAVVHASTEDAERTKLRRTIICAFGFVAGFTLMFVTMGAFAATIGGFFHQNQAVLNVGCGIIVIVLGLNFMGVFDVPLLNRTLRADARIVPKGFFSSVLFGIVFSIGWTPCVGAFLGSALTLAAATGSTIHGVLLLLCYSLGLGIPFVLSAVLIDRLEGAFTWIKQHYRAVNMGCGVLLVLVGVLISTGMMGVWLAALA